jgi:hypothetical protein
MTTTKKAASTTTKKKQQAAAKVQTPAEQIMTLLRSTNREGVEELIEYLSKSDFFTAPASTKYHGAYPGGLAEHSLNVLDSLMALYSFLKKEKYNVPELTEDSMIVVALLHDLCKINCYTESYRNEKVYRADGSKHDAGGNFEWESVKGYKREPLLAMGHGGKSIFIIQNFIALSVEEAQAIFWHMGAYDTSPYNTWDEMGQAYEGNLLAFLLHQADMLSTYILENKKYQ